jgi:hypothetical protein
MAQAALAQPRSAPPFGDHARCSRRALGCRRQRRPPRTRNPLAPIHRRSKRRHKRSQCIQQRLVPRRSFAHLRHRPHAALQRTAHCGCACAFACQPPPHAADQGPDQGARRPSGSVGKGIAGADQPPGPPPARAPSSRHDRRRLPPHPDGPTPAPCPGRELEHYVKLTLHCDRPCAHPLNHASCTVGSRPARRVQQGAQFFVQPQEAQRATRHVERSHRLGHNRRIGRQPLGLQTPRHIFVEDK